MVAPDKQWQAGDEGREPAGRLATCGGGQPEGNPHAVGDQKPPTGQHVQLVARYLAADEHQNRKEGPEHDNEPEEAVVPHSTTVSAHSRRSARARD